MESMYIATIVQKQTTDLKEEELMIAIYIDRIHLLAHSNSFKKSLKQEYPS